MTALLKPPCVPHRLSNGYQQRHERELGDGEHMLGLDIEATNPDGHDDQRPADQRLGTIIVDLVPILFRLKRLPNAKSVEVVHLDFAKEQRDAYRDECKSQITDCDGSLDV